MKHNLQKLVHSIIVAMLILACPITPAEAEDLATEKDNQRSYTNTSGDFFNFITRASIASNGAQANWHSYPGGLSADGRYVVFESEASNLVAGDTGGYSDIFVHDLSTRTTTRVSVSSSGQQANGHSNLPSISADGRFVVFESDANNLVNGDNNNLSDIFLHDRQNQTTILVSVGPNGQPLPGASQEPAISPDGRFVSFNAINSGVQVGILRSYNDIFLYDRDSGYSELVSVGFDGLPVNRWSGQVRYPSAVSSNGDFVAFISQATNLVPTGYLGAWQVFVRNRQNQTTSMVSVDSQGNPAIHPSEGSDFNHARPVISSDGRYIAFASHSNNLVPGDTNQGWDIFVRDQSENKTTRVSVSSNGVQANYGSSDYGSVTPSMSSDGRFVAFASVANNLIVGDVNNSIDVFIHDQLFGTTKLVSINSQGVLGNISSADPHLSGDGRYISFASVATNLIGNDTNNAMDVFVRDNWGIPSSDMGFQPKPDGYQFNNYGGFFPYPPAYGDFTINDMRTLFGDACICQMVGSHCYPRFEAIEWNYWINRKMNNGHCEGMAITSLRFFKGIDSPSTYQSNASTTYDLRLENIRRRIAFYHVIQATYEIASEKTRSIKNIPSEILNQLSMAISGGAVDPVILFVRQGNMGHTVVPYAISQSGNGVFYVRVYDNNYKDDANRFIVIDVENQTWRYYMGSSWGLWSGDASTNSMGIVPLSKYNLSPSCPWQATSGLSTISSTNDFGQVWYSGGGQILISNSQGEKMGFEGDQKVNEIPEAFEIIIDGGLGIQSEPVYVIPLSDTYTISLEGDSNSDGEDVTLTQFGPGYAVSIDDIPLAANSQDSIQIANDGKHITYQSENEKALTFKLALSEANSSHEFQINGADIGANQSLIFSTDTASGKLVIDHSSAGNGEYDLKIVRRNESNETVFIHWGIKISASDSHHINYRAWNGTSSLILEIDRGSNGSIDHSIELTNMSNSIYLPSIVK